MESWRRELYHHGIKGQRWGRQQGPPYPLDAEDHSPAEKKAGWRESLANKIAEKKRKDIRKASQRYQKKYKMSKQEADEAAERKAKFVKNIAIGVGVAAGTAAAIYLARQIGRNYFDETIKAGTTIQTLAHDKDRLTNGKAFFEAHRKMDMQMYIGGFGKDFSGVKNKINAVANSDVKIASTPTAKKVFNNLMKNDPVFRDSYNKLGLDAEAPKFNPRYLLSSKYAKFNLAEGIGGNKEVDSMMNKFHGELKKMGYGGLHDLNDRMYSGYNTKANIIFDNSNFSVLNQNTRKLNNKEIMKGKLYYHGKLMLDHKLNPGSVALGASALGYKAVKKYDKKVAKEAKKRREFAYSTKPSSKTSYKSS